jgi:hypothetical protein
VSAGWKTHREGVPQWHSLADGGAGDDGTKLVAGLRCPVKWSRRRPEHEQTLGWWKLDRKWAEESSTGGVIAAKEEQGISFGLVDDFSRRRLLGAWPAWRRRGVAHGRRSSMPRRHGATVVVNGVEWGRGAEMGRVEHGALCNTHIFTRIKFCLHRSAYKMHINLQYI